MVHSCMHVYIDATSSAPVTLTVCVCMCLRHNVSDEEYESYTKAYDMYRKSLTANRTPLYATTLPELAMNWSRGFSAKYHMHVDTAARLLLQTGQYWLHSSFAKLGGAFDPLKLDMCALRLLRSVSCARHALLRRLSCPDTGVRVREVFACVGHKDDIAHTMHSMFTCV